MNKNIAFNSVMLVGDVGCYLMGMAFLDSSTALPAMVQSLGGNAAFLGLVLALRQASGFLAPLVMAHRVHGATRFKPPLVWAAFWGRVFLFPAAILVAFYGDKFPTFCLIFLTLALIAAWVGDGAGAVPWTTLVGKMIPAQQRGRLFAVTQVFAGVVRLFLSGVVATLISGRVFGFPQNMGLLILACGVMLAFSWFFIVGFREPEDDTDHPPGATNLIQEPPVGFVTYLRSLPLEMRAYPAFGLLAAAQFFLLGTGAMMPFVIGYAESLGTRLPTELPPVIAWVLPIFRGGLPGLFLAAQTVGLLMFASFWGWLNDKHGPKSALLGLFVVALCCPILLLFGAGAGGSLPLFLLAYLCYGATMDIWIPVTNYLIDSVPTEKQATFFGLLNLISAPALLLPLIAGFIIQNLGAVPLFVETLILLLLGLALSTRLPVARR